MRAIWPSFTAGRVRSSRRRIPALRLLTLVAALTLTVTACESGGGDPAEGETGASAAAGGKGKITIPDDIKDKLKEHGIDLDEWQNGAWKNWDRDDWLREAKDYVNPVIEGLWDPDRMRGAKDPDRGVDSGDLSGDRGVTDPTPKPVRAQDVSPTYHANAAEAGKLFFDSPQGTMVCSATVVRDPAHPGKSNMVWTAGHCVHAGKSGGWYRNIAFVPSYNDRALSAAELGGATKEQAAPYGIWWADWAQTSDQWIARGGPTRGDGAPYDFAVLHVKPEAGGDGKSLEEMVGSALPVDFRAPAVPRVESVTAIGYPAAPPYDGQKLYRCQDRGSAFLRCLRSDDVPHRLHHDRRVVRRRLDRDGIGRQTCPGVEHLDRTCGGRLAGGPASGTGSTGRLRRGEQEVCR